jgi:glycosyltransferase involved in cell wall biosynthesis
VPSVTNEMLVGCHHSEVPNPERLVAVSHACVVPSNQGVFAALARLGREVDLVVPSRWQHEYADRVVAQVAPGLEGHVSRLAVLGRGRPQRHVYRTSATAWLRRRRPATLLVEEEPFSLAARQWCGAASRCGIPFGVQVAETLDRAMPWPASRLRDRTLRDAAFVVARSPTAAALATTWGAEGAVRIVPHSVADVAARPTPEGPPTIAFVGRLVEAKGLEDLLDAVELLDGRVRLLVAGDGPLRSRVASAGQYVELVGPTPNERIGDVYARAHVTCVPSRTTATWVEQFGRVVIESLARGVPVVACATGELPWVLGATGGGVLVPARDPHSLAEALESLTADRGAAEALGAVGRGGTLRVFSDDAAARSLDELLSSISSR